MSIEFIRPDEIPYSATMRRNAHSEFQAVRSLAVGEAIKFPCRWKHDNKQRSQGYCTGRLTIYQVANRERSFGRTMFLRSVCVDGTLYVERLTEPTDRRGRETERRLQLERRSDNVGANHPV